MLHFTEKVIPVIKFEQYDNTRQLVVVYTIPDWVKLDEKLQQELIMEVNLKLGIRVKSY